MALKEFKYKVKIKGEVEDVYAALVNPFAIELWTGEKAVMSEEPGTEFELWSGDICGMNLEFEKNRKVVQEWYFGEQEEASIVTIKVEQNKGQVNVWMKHTNIPEEAYDEMITGWTQYYWGAVKKFVEMD